jgi:hypothetical protein
LNQESGRLGVQGASGKGFLAASFSLIFPGVGQWMAGCPGRGLTWAFTMVLALIFRYIGIFDARLVPESWALYLIPFLLLGLFCITFGVFAAEPATTSPSATTSKSFIYKKIDKVELEMAVDFPPGWKEIDHRPAIVFFFGGGWTNGTIKSFETQASYLASRGMVAALGRIIASNRGRA